MTSTINAPRGSQKLEGGMRNRDNHLKIQHLYLLNKQDVQDDIHLMANYAPITISENEEYYQVELFASGRERTNFIVKLKGQQLRISYRSTVSNELNQCMGSQFQKQMGGGIDRIIDLEKPIVSNRVFASYENDILTVIMQIQQNNEEYEQQIPVS